MVYPGGVSLGKMPSSGHWSAVDGAYRMKVGLAKDGIVY